MKRCDIRWGRGHKLSAAFCSYMDSGTFWRITRATRSAADPIREALGILAFYIGTQPRRVGEIAKVVVAKGLDKILLPNVHASNEAASQRAMGVMLSPYVGETFEAKTVAERITYRLKKEQSRFGEPHPHYRYTFEEVGREAIDNDASHGPVLEESPVGSDPLAFEDFSLDEYTPEEL